ncbi:MAG: OmpA family protein, partial [Cyanobacteria bacterium J06650_10]
MGEHIKPKTSARDQDIRLGMPNSTEFDAAKFDDKLHNTGTENGIENSRSSPQNAAAQVTAAEDLQSLRELILGDSLDDTIRAHLSPDVISTALPAAFSATQARQAEMTVAITPAVERAIQSSVQNDSSTLAEALFPVIGPATRKSITAAIGSLVESLNKTLEHSLSLESFKWRLEAKRTGKTFAEVVLIRTLIYQVEQAFLIQKETGLVIQHIVADTAIAQDPDLVSAMLTAIQDFVQDSFAVESDQALDTLKLGDFTLFIESGPQAVLAAVVRGSAPQELRAIMRSQLEKIHAHFSTALHSYDGDPTTLAGAGVYLQNCFQAKFKGAKKKKQRQPLSKQQKRLGWCLAGILVSGLGLWAILNWQSNRQWQQFIGELHREPGLVVINQFKKGRTYYLQGLRDPLANNPQSLLAATRLNPNNVELNWSPYLSLAPEFLQNRTQSLLSPPATVSIDLDADGVLNVSGRATSAWIAMAKQTSAQLEGITGWNDTALVSIEQEDLATLRDRIEYRRFAFVPGKAVLQSERYTQTLYNQAQDIKTLFKTA